jgi:hypothetical protein
MTTHPWIRLAEIAFALVLVAIIFVSWREDRRDRSQLAVQLAAAQQALNAADARQHDRDAQLQQSLAAIAQSKRTVQSPTQILADLPDQLPLPTPLSIQSVLQPAGIATSSTGTSVYHEDGRVYPEERKACAGVAKGQPLPKGCTAAPSNAVVIPPEDLKPLYDFTLDCKACQSKLATTQADLADERTKTAGVAKERDAALQAAKGGTLLRRIGRAAKWFAIGAAAGALAAKSAHH